MNFKTQINIESTQRIDSFEKLKETLDNKEIFENKIAQALADQLQLNAQVKLHSSLGNYINSISVQDGSLSLDTSDFITNMVENGIPSFDQKPGFLASNKAKINTKGTKYLVVPLSKFRQGRYNWRDQKTGRFDKGSNIGGDVEFRLVSENSNPQSWIHPGHPGFNLIEETMNQSDEIIERILDDEIDSILNNI